MLRAAFPAGTVSGAPKVRAMEIIDELEPSRRGVYAGAVGYVSFQDDMDTAIAIRTAVVKDGMLYAQAGAGIVHDSVPEIGVARRRRTRRAPCCAPPRWCSRGSTPRRERRPSSQSRRAVRWHRRGACADSAALLGGFVGRRRSRVGIDRHAAPRELADDQLGARIALVGEDRSLAGEPVERRAQLARILELPGLIAVRPWRAPASR